MDLLTVLPPASISRSVPSLFTDAGAFAKIILVVLFVISVVSWAVMIDRIRLFLRLRANANALRKALARRSFADCMADAERYMPSVEGAILQEARRHFSTQHAEKSADGRMIVETAAQEEVERSKLRDVLERRALNEIGEMESHMIFLSTTSSAAPFLGLLGTVWGIMSSFLSMGAQGTASIEVVGPGIAEALVTTIAGLAAAIPALVAYNLLVRQIHRKETRVDLFISRVIEHFVVARSHAVGSPGGREPRRTASEASV